MYDSRTAEDLAKIGVARTNSQAALYEENGHAGCGHAVSSKDRCPLCYISLEAVPKIAEIKEPFSVEKKETINVGIREEICQTQSLKISKTN